MQRLFETAAELKQQFGLRLQVQGPGLLYCEPNVTLEAVPQMRYTIYRKLSFILAVKKSRRQYRMHTVKNEFFKFAGASGMEIIMEEHTPWNN